MKPSQLTTKKNFFPLPLAFVINTYYICPDKNPQSFLKFSFKDFFRKISRKKHELLKEKNR